jgi:hypothetical protein
VLLIGIDEAGYGPKLGPLCHGCCALRCGSAADGAPPDLWHALHPHVTRHPARNGGIAVDDSKKVYSSGSGLGDLARGVSAFLECSAAHKTDHVADHDLFRGLLAADDLVRLEEDSWARHDGACEPARAAEAPHLAGVLAEQGVSVLAVGARALSAKHFNAALRSGANKADASWSVIAGELRRMLALASPGESVHVTIDRQGGRKFYSAQVAALFPGALPWVEEETPHRSVYRLELDERIFRFAFLVEAESASLPVALASMSAKLARELCITRLNAFFRRHLPDLEPTAGYATDAKRFLRETATLRRKLGITDESFVRAK